MSIKDDLKSVSQEISSILAGFKLALIVISYFGLGSVAKWVISHWYPFTRWLWDLFCEYYKLPIFPVVVKDSLTALVFFIPLAMAAIIEIRKKSEDENKNTHRLLGAFFGFLFLVLICKDVISSIVYELSNMANLENSIIRKIIVDMEIAFEFFTSLYGFLAIILYFGSGMFVFFYTRKNPNQRKLILRYVRKMSGFGTSIFAAMSAGSLLYAFAWLSDGSRNEAERDIVVAISIMFIIVTIILAAVAFSPRKLFVTAGACIAFVAAAMCFELVVWFVSFIENAPAQALI